MKIAVELNSLLKLCHVDIQQNSHKDNEKLNFLGIIW